ncbi:hypothetical protein [Bacillus sp. cl95]|uniref:hypothetical protein n=2 Tax=unclassified Bacillus (in: firmicutes) TaxID=185979 RepID=UPI00158732DC|nr:hypothetical protein [Bacillus sp. cl95]
MIHQKEEEGVTLKNHFFKITIATILLVGTAIGISQGSGQQDTFQKRSIEHIAELPTIFNNGNDGTSSSLT